ncbi:MAG: hypothetical protein KY464_09270 [Gemmatimonadetes bacterium]|nr:hypothetical protein [Gemmatimonadota bacterium]
MRQPTVQKRPRRRHRVPFPLTDTAELFEGGEILREFDSDVAVVLWKSYKNVMLWAGAHHEDRAGLFATGAGERRRAEIRATSAEAAIEQPLQELAALLDAPGEADAVMIAGACRALSAWAAARNASASALLFMQAAALTSPADADAACSVGRMARNRAEYARAETWFRQAIVAARAAENWTAYTQAYVGLGKVFTHRGALPSARRALVLAYRTATRHHLRELRGWALSDLGIVSIQAGRWADACACIRNALTIYGPAHPLSANLVHDVAYGWIKEGWFAPAVRLLAKVGPRLSDRLVRVHVSSSLARASGGAGDGTQFNAAVAELRDLSTDPALAALMPDAWLDVAHGAASLGRWDSAEQAAAAALRLAENQAQARVRFEAEATLASIRGDRVAATLRGASAIRVPNAVSELASELAGLLDETADAHLVGASAV